VEHTLDLQKIERSFSNAAMAYDRCAKSHPYIAKKLVSLLPEHVENILELGCGTGILTELLCSKYPQANITAIDISKKMIEQCKKRCNCRNISLLTASAEEFQPNKNFDLIVSSNSFHWFLDKETVSKNIRQSLVPGGKFAIAMGIRGIFSELHTIYEEIKGNPLAHLWNEKECREKFSQLSLPMETVIFDSFQMEEPTPWEVLRSIHGIGAVPRGFSQSLSIGELKKLVRKYSQSHKSKNGVSVTYNIFYGITEGL